MAGNLDCLKYAHENGCPWPEASCYFLEFDEYYYPNNNIELDNHLKCLKYVHENGCPWSTKTCQFFAAFDCINCLKYAHENGCPWSTETCHSAWENDCLECLEYAHKNGCPYPEDYKSKIVKKIVKEILIPKWRDSVKIRPYILHWIEDTAKRLCAETGKGRKRDYDTFVEDFNNLVNKV
jgi:hypothetical protein